MSTSGVLVSTMGALGAAAPVLDHRGEAPRTLLTDEFLANIWHIPCNRRAADLGRPGVHPKLTMHGLANVVTLIIGLVGPSSWR
jgi:hypothetical protein